jgi:hypothetical protein
MLDSETLTEGIPQVHKVVLLCARTKRAVAADHTKEEAYPLKTENNNTIIFWYVYMQRLPVAHVHGCIGWKAFIALCVHVARTRSKVMLHKCTGYVHHHR